MLIWYVLHAAPASDGTSDEKRKGMIYMANADKAVYVRRLDSVMVFGWQSEAVTLSEIQSVGYLVHEDDKHVEIAQICFDERGEFNGVFAIPKSVILERRTLRIGKA